MAYYPVIKKKREMSHQVMKRHEGTFIYFFLSFFFFLIYFFIVVGFVIHWNESAMGLMKEL